MDVGVKFCRNYYWKEKSPGCSRARGGDSPLYYYTVVCAGGKNTQKLLSTEPIRPKPESTIHVSARKGLRCSCVALKPAMIAPAAQYQANLRSSRIARAASAGGEEVPT